MSYSIEEITTLIGARRIGSKNASIDWMLTDSRSLAIPETTLFFALKTEHGDGHDYIRDLYEKGVRHFVVQELDETFLQHHDDANFLKVPNSLRALQRLAERTREEFDVPIIGVTGSNGKTMVKEWLYQILSSSFQVTRSPRSYNSQVGVPLSVLLLNKNTEVGVFEAGISQRGEMEALRDIIQPTIGIMTNLGQAHGENFLDDEEKCKEKLRLFSDCETIIYNADDLMVDSCMKALFQGKALCSWSNSQDNVTLRVLSLDKEGGQTRIHYRYDGEDSSFCIPFIDDASIRNALHCFLASCCLNIDRKVVEERMAHLEPIAMRLEVINGARNCILINDSYNSDVNSLDIALDFMQRRPDSERRPRTVILSDIVQGEKDKQKLYSEVARLLVGRGVDKLIGIGSELLHYAHLFPMKSHFFKDAQSFIESQTIEQIQDELVLIKGARKFYFEEICEALSLKVHETTLEVNLTAIKKNLDHYRRLLKNNHTKMVCMIKASAYGAGSVEIAKTLQECRVDYLAVAVADEGVELRNAGIRSNIIIMNPEMTTFRTMFRYGLEPEVYSFKLLDALVHAAEREGITNFPVHIKIDTGMHRLGFDPSQDMTRLIERLKGQSSLLPRSVFSHFVGSDSSDFDDFTREQFHRFDEASQMLQAAFPHKIIRHICNSAGIERFPEYQLDMVRLGLGLYGINPATNRTLNNVSTLHTTILQIRSVPQLDTVGYSRKGKLSRVSRIAAIPIGYADGLDRHLGQGKGFCLVNGMKAPYVGNICMDVCMIDVTDILCQEGDQVEIFGDNLPVSDLSEQLGTIPYEILTSISPRVKRVYFQD